MSRQLTAAVLMSMSLVLMACNSSSSSNTPAGQTASQPSAEAITVNDLDLSAVTLGKSKVAPLSRVELHNVPASVTVANLYVEYRLQSDTRIPGPGNSTDNGFAAVVREAGENEAAPRYWLSAPLAYPDGADLALRVTDGASYSRVMNLEVGALPPPNPDITLDAVLDDVEDLLRTVTEAYDLTYPDDLQAMMDTPASVRVEYLPLIRAYHAIGNPDNANGLRQLDLDDQSQQVLDRLLAHWSPGDRIRDRATFVTNNADLIEEVVPYLAASSGTAPDLGPSGVSDGDSRTLQPTTRSTIADPLQDLMLPAAIDINSPSQLEYWMGRYGEMYRLQRDIQRGVDIAEDVVMVIGTASIIASGPAGIKGASSVVALSQAADTAVSIAGYTNDAFRMVRALAPCCMLDIELELSPESGVISQEDAGSPALLLQEVNAFVTSDAIDLAGELMSIAIDEAAGKVSGKLSERFQDSDLAELTISNNLESLYEGYEFVGKRTYFSWEVNLVDHDPERWVDIELDGLAGGPVVFKQLETLFGQFRFDLDENAFFGQEQSPTILRAGPKTEAFDFGPWNPPIPGGSSEVSAETIEVTTSPDVIRIEEPGETIEFSVTVRNAIDFGLNDSELYDLDPSLGSIAGVTSGQSTGVYTYRYTAPADELPENFFVTLFAESTQGVRGRTPEPADRFTTLAFTASQPRLRIEPGGACLEVGSQQTFTAIDPDNGDPLPADWSVSGPANLVSDGVVQASGEGTVTLTATHPDDPDRTDQIQFIAGDCTCWWSGRVDGDFGHRLSSDVLTIDFDDNRALSRLHLISNVGVDDGNGMTFIADSPIPAGATGTFTFSEASGMDFKKSGYQSVWLNPTPFDPALTGLAPIAELEVTLTRHNMLDQGEFADLVEPGTRQLTGTVTGTVVNDHLISTSPTEIERLQGILDARFQGDFWGDLGNNRLNCSRGLGL